MVTARKHADKLLIATIISLLVAGFFVFISAAMGTLARGEISIFSVALNHIVLGLGLGVAAMYIVSRINYRVWKQLSPYIFGISIILTALVFVPALGLHSGGATRWLLLGPISTQPAEFLKIATILFFATYLAQNRARIGTIKYGIGGFVLVLAVPAILLLLQPDTGTLGVVVLSLGAMFLTAGARLRDLTAVGIIIILALMLLVFTRPYLLERVMTFVNPMSDPQGSSYQLRQSLIAVGSGGITGRGFGQSIQKFSYLPEPMSDSIFAVAAEEFGIIGSFVLLLLFLTFASRGFSIASHAPDYFGALLCVGIVTYICGQAFINIAAIVGLIPLTGIPLVFVSQGGTSMLVALGSAGIILSVSRYAKVN